MDELFVLIVTGLSGAGKSTALSRLEDCGYYCVDNLPGMLIGGLVEQCLNAKPAISRLAVGIDGRGSAFGLPAPGFKETLSHTDYRILFLDCNDEALLRRYIETRRRHPFGKGGDVAAGIAYERALLLDMRERAHMVIDTSGLTPLMLCKRLDETLREHSSANMDILITSFGFKRGLPVDADMVIDTRFFPNPFYERELRHLSGLDESVRDYVMSDAQAEPFFASVTDMLLAALPGYKAQGKQRVMIAFGCTGGRHRSVAAAEELKKRIASQYHSRCYHRDLTAEAEDIGGRFGVVDS